MATDIEKDKKLELLEKLLKEKDIQLDEEVRNKLSERQQVESYREKLRLMANLVKVNEEKLIDIVRKVVNLYGKEIIDKKH
tara:strand:- start:895 stop:1137 length:243 start_codon:yes stop_codon:yes gene_type:complete